ncbi:phosphonate C-P lyase system protein PhnG [Cognatiyoonia sp. IB215446]|uniref:phosphonate C-P lyase system protein PhnG n=1 Tax=Cognatiyoonia sp. IB215446 TaxID=3097355 RepID=UPI002A11DA3D|nr:phosphonate C-P lyase system protein PhnG [Cognatiyoonia sp. IB215446]MDX8350510.1 phosphonate C-P lyase system protein PhnG [Cognatiyoonia sp. IB215446]
MPDPQSLEAHPHDKMLSVLARANADRLKAFAEPLIGQLGAIEVLENRTGLVMLPMQDTAQGTNFHLGEVLVSEARIAADGQEGYGMRRGRDLEAAMAMALIDLAVASGIAHEACTVFITTEEAAQAREDHDRLCRVEATRVDMETF